MKHTIHEAKKQNKPRGGGVGCGRNRKGEVKEKHDSSWKGRLMCYSVTFKMTFKRENKEQRGRERAASER